MPNIGDLPLISLPIVLSKTYIEQSAFTPFLAEHIYQSLRNFFKSPEQLGLGSDLRSIHFLSFPVVRQEYFDTVVERQVRRMQSVIELGRLGRDKRKVAVKVSFLVY